MNEMRSAAFLMISQKITIYEMGERKLKCRVEKCHSNRCHLITFEVVFKPSRISRCTVKHFSNKILAIAHQSKIMSYHFQFCCASFCQLHFFELLEIHICVFDTKMQHATNCHCRNIQLAIRVLVVLSYRSSFIQWTYQSHFRHCFPSHFRSCPRKVRGTDEKFRWPKNAGEIQ